METAPTGGEGVYLFLEFTIYGKIDEDFEVWYNEFKLAQRQNTAVDFDLIDVGTIPETEDTK